MGLFKHEVDRDIYIEQIKLYCHTKNEIRTHGMGMILKKPKKDFKRVNILSRHIAICDGRPVVLRMLKKLILTNATRSPKLTTDEAHYLAAMSFLSFSSDPLSLKLMQARL